MANGRTQVDERRRYKNEPHECVLDERTSSQDRTQRRLERRRNRMNVFLAL